MTAETKMTTHSAIQQRRWHTIKQLVAQHPEFTEAAIRSLIQRSRPHYNHRGECVQGNGLASAVCQPGGKNGKVLIDASAFADWLESWAGQSTDTVAEEAVA
jgi:hypothetical protein